MCAAPARISRTSITLSSTGVASSLSALRVAGVASRPASRLTGRLVAPSLARLARRLVAGLAGLSTLRSTTGVASSTGIGWTCVAESAAGVETCSSAGTAATHTSQAGLRITGALSGTFRRAGGLAWKALCLKLSSSSQADVEIEVVLPGLTSA